MSTVRPLDSTHGHTAPFIGIGSSARKFLLSSTPLLGDDQSTNGVHDRCRFPLTEPMTEYVISVRAYNRVGEGQSLQDTVRTLPEAQVAAPTALKPPVGLKGETLL